MKIKDLGLIDYQEAWDVQKQCVDQVIKNPDCNFLLMCEHPSVLTLGRLADRSHILYSDVVLKEKGIRVLSIDRGGEVTLHTPGQLVIYPILNLERIGKDLHAYLYKLEQVGIDFLNLFGIMGGRVRGKTGVWIDKRKIMSVGVGVRKWVSFHGISININTDLSFFDMINPCGMEILMTSLAREKNCFIDMNEAKVKVVDVFEKVFGQIEQ